MSQNYFSKIKNMAPDFLKDNVKIALKRLFVDFYPNSLSESKSHYTVSFPLAFITHSNIASP